MDDIGKETERAAGAPGALSGAMGLRAMLLALVASVLGALAANYHDGVILHTEVSQQNAVAPLALAFFFLFVLLVNSVLARLYPRRAFSGAELGVALALALIATPLSRSIASNWVSTIGYTHSLVDAENRNLTALTRANIYEALPEHALLSPAESRVFDDGVAPHIGRMARVRDIPWRVWLRPALYWTPLLLCFLALSLSMAHVLYRQWAERELVPFPLAELAGELLRRDRGRYFPDIFYVRGFWYGFGLLAIVFAVNGYHAHEPKMIEIPIKFSFYDLSQQFPFLKNSLEGYSLLRGWSYFAVVAAAVLLPSEISLTSWATWPIMICCTYFYYVQTGQRFGGLENNMMMTGSFWAMAVVILYAGRVYYLALLRRAVGFGARAGETGGLDVRSIRTCRFFLLSAAAFVVILKLYGIPLDLAVIWTLAMLMLFLVLCRLVAEMGIPWMPLANQGPLTLMITLLGEKALGAKAYSMMSIVHNLTLNNTVFVAPVALNATHVEARLAGRVSGLKLLAPFAVIVVTACAATAIWIGYSSEGAANDYPIRGAATLNTAATTIQNLYLRGENPPAMRELVSLNAPWRERWAALRVDPRFPALFACGAGLVLLVGFARLRFPTFPLHPLPLVLLGTWLMSRYFFSFFLGWLIKTAILKIGGGRLFERTKPFFVGVVTGMAFIFAFWVVANIGIYRNNNFTFKSEWAIIFRDMFSS